MKVVDFEIQWFFVVVWLMPSTASNNNVGRVLNFFMNYSDVFGHESSTFIWWKLLIFGWMIPCFCQNNCICYFCLQRIARAKILCLTSGDNSWFFIEWLLVVFRIILWKSNLPSTDNNNKLDRVLNLLMN